MIFFSLVLFPTFQYFLNFYKLIFYKTINFLFGVIYLAFIIDILTYIWYLRFLVFKVQWIISSLMLFLQIKHNFSLFLFTLLNESVIFFFRNNFFWSITNVIAAFVSLNAFGPSFLNLIINFLYFYILLMNKLFCLLVCVVFFNFIRSLNKFVY